ncbi:Glycosyltransferase 2-like [Fusarium oxysporum f. sp. vasinfectum]|nr:Glycosyltransferase 2-like [Fusarium oxysporum f. sp. vasinfectum]
MVANTNKYSVILPTYNERKNLPIITWLLNRTFTENNLDWELIIVDDGSPDGTQEVAQQLVKVYSPPRCPQAPRWQTRSRNSLRPRSQVRHRQLCHHHGRRLLPPPQVHPQMVALQAKGNYDIVTGTRYAGNGGVFGWDLKRKFVSRGANLFADTVLRPGVSDLTGSFRLYKRAALEKAIASTESKGYSFQMELMVRAKAMGCTVAEVPISFVDRLYGESKLGGDEIVQYAQGVFNLWLKV